MEQKITPCFSNSALAVVATDTESNTASTATPSMAHISDNGIPNFLYVSIISGGKCSTAFGLFCPPGAE